MAINNKLISHRCKIALLLGLGLTFSHAFAGTAAFNVLGGVSSFNFGNEKDIVFPTNSFRTDTFDVSGQSAVFALGAGFTYDVMICHNNDCDKGWSVFHDIAVGINGYYNSNDRKGTVLEYGLPNFNNSTYKMNVYSSRLMADAELGLHPIKMGLTPFIEAGIGVARNTLDFQNTPVPSLSGGYYYLSDHYHDQFAYELGAGFKIPVNNDVTISARYLYANAGNAVSSIHDHTNGVTLGSPIKINVRSQSILLGFSHSFG